ncbi:hypothetical protein MO973_00020 [Paenibacillus sp. TRM 82003]|nr:hypothetical protein [Paenibacillus sp. TRM 82003]
MDETVIMLPNGMGKESYLQVEQRVRSVRGVERSLIDVTKGEMFIEYDESVTTPEQIQNALQQP